MSTHDKIDLPPPAGHYYEWDGVYGKRKFTAAPHNGRECDRAVAYYTADQVRAAIEADRKRTADLLKNPIHVHANMCRGIIAPITFDQLAHVLGDDATEAWLADRKRRGEPVAWGAFYFGGKRNGKLYSHTETEAQIDAYIADVHRSNDSITLRKGPLYTAPQPAEPVKSSLKVSYDAHGDCLYVVCDSNEPADAEEDDKGILYRRAISDGRLVGITIMNFMGRHAESRYGKGTP